ncbi:MAG: hypothetical protein HY929_08020 [Euryarchaeota archaeon]|nr:hypothetical protein [Euryarchaeota archaeon]
MSNIWSKIREKTRKLGRWRLLAICIVLVLVVLISGRSIHFVMSQVSLTDAQKQKAIDVAKSALKDDLAEMGEYKVYIDPHGWKLRVTSGDKRVLFVYFTTENKTIRAMTDIDAWEVVLISKTEYRGWMVGQHRLSKYGKLWIHKRWAYWNKSEWS